MAKDEAGSLSILQGIMCGVSSRQPEDKEVSLCLMCAHIAIAFLLRIIFGGSLKGTKRSKAAGGARCVASQATVKKRLRHRKVCVKT